MITQVKEYNRQALKRYDERVKEWDFSKGGFPCRAMYVFNLDNGELRKNGYVVSKDNSHYFFLNKDKAILKEQSI